MLTEQNNFCRCRRHLFKTFVSYTRYFSKLTMFYRYVNISDPRFFAEQGEANSLHQNTLEPENNCIPLLYWTSKQHKNPYKFRFISGANHSYNKTISVQVSLALKHIKTHFKNFCSTIKSIFTTSSNFCFSKTEEVTINKSRFCLH